MKDQKKNESFLDKKEAAKGFFWMLGVGTVSVLIGTAFVHFTKKD